jgi:hypothetical protein
MLCITVTLVLFIPLVKRFILPAYDQWCALKSTVGMQVVEYDTLKSNLLIKESVDKQFERLGDHVWQLESDQITLSNYLRELETLARHPSMTLINMKPIPAQLEDTHKIYRLKLTVAGKLQEILQFVSELTHGTTVTGLEAFSLRAVQGINIVECNLSLWMVQLIPESLELNRETEQHVAYRSEVTYGQ